MKKLYLAAFTLLFLLLVKPCYAEAGTLKGDEAIGGGSYLLSKYYENNDGSELSEYMKDKNIIDLDKKSYDILCRIVEAEATGGNIEQKMNVASCIIARVNSDDWPDTVEGVVFQNNGKVWQFSPISDGRYYTVPIKESTEEAVNYILKNGPVHDYTFFCTQKSYNKDNSFHRNKLTYGFYDGEHVYCK